MSQDRLKDEFVHASIHTLEQAELKIRHCAGQLSADQVWHRPGPGQNSIGNLLLHLAGNLQQWGVVPFSNGVDERNREQEFLTDQAAPTTDLLNRLSQVIETAKTEWAQLTSEDLTRKLTIQGFEVTGCLAITHTVSHFVGHTHQIITLTRLQLGESYRFHWTPEQPRTDVPI